MNSSQSSQSSNKLDSGSSELDHNNGSDHVVALTQLREQIANLNKQLQQKDQQLLAKDRQITDLRASNFTTENELRNKLKDAQRDYEIKVQNMTIKMKTLQKELASKSKIANKAQQKSSLTIVGRNSVASQILEQNESSKDGKDSDHSSD